MIKRRTQFALVLLPLLLASGCGNIPFLGGGEEDAAVIESQPIPVAPAQADNNGAAEATGEDAEGEDFEDPLVEGEEKPREPKAAEGLIPLASEDAAAKLAQSGRQDPFATLPIDTETIASSAAGVNAQNLTTVVPKLPQLPITPNIQIPGGIGPFAVAPQNTPQPVSVAPQNTPPPAPQLPVVPSITIPAGIGPSTLQPEEPLSDVPFSTDGLPESETFAPELPPLPEPTLANELVVTGVVTSKGISQAIVEGSDGKSTYVREGDYVANGQVLVKRIEASKGGPTLVVFEELGIEVVKNVGQGASVS